jgi:FtsH-binding integral membrane protein
MSITPLLLVVRPLLASFGRGEFFFSKHGAPRFLKRQQQSRGTVIARNDFSFLNNPYNPSLNRQNYERRSIEDFQTRGSRLGFIRKVYAIFGAQMLCTVFVTFYIGTHSAAAKFLAVNFDVIGVLTMVGSLSIVGALVKVPKLRYEMPTNFLLLGLYTLLQSLTVGTFASFLDPKIVCLGTLHTLTVLVALTLYSFQPSPAFDLSAIGSTLLATLSSLLLGSLLAGLLNFSLRDNLMSGLLAVVFAGYMAMDVQQIVGGTHTQRQYSSKEYILAALNLHQDVISFFIQVLKLLMQSQKKKERHKE